MIRSEPIRRAVASPCTVPDCVKPVHGHGLCSKHYTRLLRNGSVDFVSYIRGDDAARFRSSYVVSESGCWNWNKNIREGYGRFYCNGKLQSAHCYSWEVINGKIPDDRQINHECNNPACVNPAHLYLGTQVENMADMISANRGGQLKGEAHARHKLSVKSVKEILSSSESTAALARKFGVSESAVRFARKGKTWKSVVTSEVSK